MKSVGCYVQPRPVDVNLLVLQDGDEVVTLADENEDVAGVHCVVLHDVQDEEKVAPVVVQSWCGPQLPVLHGSCVAVTSDQGILHMRLLRRLLDSIDWFRYYQVLFISSGSVAHFMKLMTGIEIVPTRQF